jgi:hypothetical protein
MISELNYELIKTRLIDDDLNEKTRNKTIIKDVTAYPFQRLKTT